MLGVGGAGGALFQGFGRDLGAALAGGAGGPAEVGRAAAVLAAALEGNADAKARALGCQWDASGATLLLW